MLAAGSAAVTLLAGVIAAAAQSTPTDYAGIAMIIAASSTAIGTIGGLIIAGRRRSSAKDTLELLHELKAMERGGDVDVP